MAPRTVTLRSEWVEEAQKRWGWLLAFGIIVAALGVIGLSMLFVTTLVSVFAFAVLLLGGGIAHLVQTFTGHGAGSKLVQALIALLYLVTAVLIFTDPVAATLSLTIILAAMLFVVGILRIVGSLDLRPLPGWGGLFTAGFLEILLAILIFIGWPVSGLWLIGLFISIDLLMAGLGSIAVALQLRRGRNRPLEA